jgi:transposase InsO family protein
MTSVWVAEHGWCYLNAAIDCCTREITGWALDVRCRAPEAIAVIERAAATRAVAPGRLTLGTDGCLSSRLDGRWFLCQSPDGCG